MLQSHHERKTTIFDKYSETGDKIAAEKQKRKSSSSRKPSLVKSRVLSDTAPSSGGHRNGTTGSAQTRSPVKSSLSKTQDSSSQSEAVFGKGTPLPDINGGEPRRPSVKDKRKVSVSDPPVVNGDSFRRDSNSEGERNQSPKDNDSAEGQLGDSDKELSALITNQDSNQEEEEQADTEVNFRSLVISPVPTPVLYRPETREMTRLSMADTMTQVLDGYVHRRCPPDNKVIRLYIMGGYTG